MTTLSAKIAEALAPVFEGIVETITEKVLERTEMAQAAKTPRYYTRQEVAALLQVSVATVGRLTRAGDLIALRIPNSRGVRYNANEVDTALREKRLYKYKHR
jgi:excisionase family DNA binding protein